VGKTSFKKFSPHPFQELSQHFLCVRVFIFCVKRAVLPLAFCARENALAKKQHSHGNVRVVGTGVLDGPWQILGIAEKVGTTIGRPLESVDQSKYNLKVIKTTLPARQAVPICLQIFSHLHRGGFQKLFASKIQFF